MYRFILRENAARVRILQQVFLGANQSSKLQIMPILQLFSVSQPGAISAFSGDEAKVIRELFDTMNIPPSLTSIFSSP